LFVRELRTCVDPSGRFTAGIHRPSYRVANLRISDCNLILGKTETGKDVDNRVNFPTGDLLIRDADRVYEIPNAFPFWGVTYILGRIAEENGAQHAGFSFKPAGSRHFPDPCDLDDIDLSKLPRALLLTIAQTCTDPVLLSRLTPMAASLVLSDSGEPCGLRFQEREDGSLVPEILDHELYDTLGNNPFLPDNLKALLLLNPGIQGTSPVVGEYSREATHIWEYLRANSYIPWGHFAANMAQDSIRYSVRDLSLGDITGLRHLYYQRIYVKLAMELGIPVDQREIMPATGLDKIRQAILDQLEILKGRGMLPRFTATLWGWNYGYDFSPSGFRLHASHQQIHQQFALVPEYAEPIFTADKTQKFPSYSVGDNVASFISQYRQAFGVPFFESYIKAIRSNDRLDKRTDLPDSLVIFEDENVMLFVPKAQRSQGEIQIICLKPTGNILEADRDTRASIDLAMLYAVKILDELGAKMITCIEVSKRFLDKSDQRLFYSFLPKHPQSPGAFSEQQGRWITGHFPEDYAAYCREALDIIG